MMRRTWDKLFPAWPNPPENDSRFDPGPMPQNPVFTHGGVTVKSLCCSVLALSTIIPALALTGCQKGSESAPAAATGATNNKADNKADSSSIAATAADDTEDPKPDPNLQHPVFAIETTAGNITVRLDAEKAPLTVNNFRNYATHGHFDQTIFHQVYSTPVQIVLGGVYTSDLKEKSPNMPIRNEADNGLKNRRGTIAMARRADDEDSATSQFFFNLSDNDSLNYKARTSEGYGYCVFGEVTEGIEVLDRIAKGPVHDTNDHKNMPVESVAIKSVRQVR
jgi:cyclophilin family peptidyl-prolyl cis-trans isomerase